VEGAVDWFDFWLKGHEDSDSTKAHDIILRWDQELKSLRPTHTLETLG
jgi:hypothetical protein